MFSRRTASDSSDPDSDAALVARVRAGDVDAFAALHRAYAPSLIGYATAQLRSRELAEELVQDLFFGIWKQHARWVLTGSLKAYLFRALRNEIAGYTRTNASRHELQQSGTIDMTVFRLPGGEAADDRVREAEVRLAIERAVASLPPRQREAFLLIRQQGLSYAEAAEVLGISVKTVEVHMVRAFEALWRQLDDWRS